MTATDTAERLLHETETKDLLRFVTCGSVDDGKSTLIGRLLYESKGIYEDQLAAVEVASKTVGSTGGELDLALVTDGLKAEREQGITIDVAYRYFSTPKRKFIIADCPGHEQYTRNMVTGASTANLAILLVDASHGVAVQTRRHAFIASLLGIKHVVVAINKMDLVDYDEKVFDAIRTEFTDFAARLSFPDLEFIPMSALAGDNVTHKTETMPWYTGRPLLEHLEEVHIAGDRNLVDMRFAVQYVSRPDRTFRGYMGSPAGGIIRKGEPVIALPSGVKSVVKDVLDPSGNSVGEAYPPMACTVTLETEIDVSRGDMLANPNNVPRVANGFDAMLVWMHPEAMALGKTYTLKHCTRSVRAEVTALRYRTDVNTLRQGPADTLELNEIGRVEITVARPIAFDPYTRNRQTGAFLLIDKQNGWTVGAGMILDRETDERHPSAEGWKGTDRRRRPRPAVHRHRSTVGPHEREKRLGQKPLCVWLTGLKGSGKTTIAYALERALFDAGLVGTVLDGGNLRSTLNSDLNFTGDDRSENVRRAAEAARLMCEAGLFSVCAFISPFEADRVLARENIAAATGPDGFIEVHLSTPLEVCRRRVSGVYEQADAGEFEDFTGVTAPYEEPRHADLSLRTDELAAEACVARIMDLLRKRGFLK